MACGTLPLARDMSCMCVCRQGRQGVQCHECTVGHGVDSVNLLDLGSWWVLCCPRCGLTADWSVVGALNQRLLCDARWATIQKCTGHSRSLVTTSSRRVWDSGQIVARRPSQETPNPARWQLLGTW
jgi:hypothetical protein